MAHSSSRLRSLSMTHQPTRTTPKSKWCDYRPSFLPSVCSSVRLLLPPTNGSSLLHPPQGRRATWWPVAHWWCCCCCGLISASFLLIRQLGCTLPNPNISILFLLQLMRSRWVTMKRNAKLQKNTIRRDSAATMAALDGVLPVLWWCVTLPEVFRTKSPYNNHLPLPLLLLKPLNTCRLLGPRRLLATHALVEINLSSIETV